MRRMNASAAGVSKLPMLESEEQHEHGTAGIARGSRLAQPFFVRRLVTDDGKMSEAREPLFRLLERLRRNVDQVDACIAPRS